LTWIRLLYLYPTTITDDILDAMAACDKVCKYVDLPLQHAADDVLRRMKRPGTAAGYQRLLARIRERVPGVSLRTTFIVGFPGENRRGVRRALRVRPRVDSTTPGSSPTHTKKHHAHDLANDVPASPSRRSAKQADGRTETHRGQGPARPYGLVRVMVDGPSPEHDLVWRGRSAGMLPTSRSRLLFTDADPEAFRPGLLLEAENRPVPADYDLVVRPVAPASPCRSKFPV
jgi:ribosomal protein S12 methylthiotransferase